MAGWALLAAAAGAAEAPHVLVLYSNNRLLPANVEADRGLRETLPDSVDLSTEFLDSPRFDGGVHLGVFTQFLREKYAARPPAVVVAGGTQALAFLLAHRGELFPGVPVVHMGVLRSSLASLPPFPADVVGVPFQLDFAATIDQSLRWHPRTKHLVLVTGAAAEDRAFEAALRNDAPRFHGRVRLEFLSGVPTATVLARLAELREGSLVFTTGYFQDGEVAQFLPRDTVRDMAAAAQVPVYSAFDTFIATGTVGGYMPTFAAMGRQGGKAVGALLAGTPPAALRLPEVMPSTLNLDWRQIVRWGIDPDAIPRDATIHFREPEFLEAHRKEASAAAVVLLLQSGLIAWLLIERRRRRLAELAVQKQRYELVHASRLAVAGELTASIAHEINQPLGAILSNADAADLILKAGPECAGDRRGELREILGDIRRDDLRASAVIQRLRALLAKQAVERRPFDLVEALIDAAAVLRTEAQRRRMTLDIRPGTTAATVVGDRVQIQQVLINLVLNAMDAMGDMPEDRRAVVVSLERTAGSIAMTVRDQGNGIAPEHLPELFDSFFSTKRTGMGLGLAIARSVCEAHGGRIWAENAPGRGAMFHVELPAASGAGMSSRGPA